MGGAGGIGSHTVYARIKSGYDVTIMEAELTRGARRWYGIWSKHESGDDQKACSAGKVGMAKKDKNSLDKRGYL